MACSLHCPNCGEDLGKDTENDALAYCGNCGEDDIYNERGDTEDMSDEDLATFRKLKRKANRNSGRIRYR